MDEAVGLDQAWPVEDIPDCDWVYRHFPVRTLTIENGRRYPNEADFAPDLDGLSTYWDRYISVKDIYLIIGLSYKRNTNNYKDYTSFKIFKLEVAFLRSLEGLNSVTHSPIRNGNPSAVGCPNSRSHTLVQYDVDNLQIRVNLSDHCRSNHRECYCEFDVKSLRTEIEELRKRLNDTPYHRYN